MKDPAFLFYPNDYIGGTMGMTFEQKGAYMDLLMMQFNRGHMTSHMIGQVLGQNGGQIWDVVKSKFKKDEEGMYYNERLEIEQLKRKSFTDSRVNNKKGNNQYTKKVGHMTTHMTTHMTSHMIGHMENENINRNINKRKRVIGEKELNISFDVFWDLYDKKVGLKSKLEMKWSNLTDKERQDIIDYIPEYKKAEPDKQLRKNPETFLNNESWHDELIYKKKPKYTEKEINFQVDQPNYKEEIESKF
jgi:uncharacterized protein YdaU (DUF1376 family)